MDLLRVIVGLLLATLSVAQGTLPFLELGTTVGVQHISVSAQNGLSSVISIPEGFTFGNSTQTSVYVAIHGYFSFGREEACCPSPSVPNSRNSDYIVAPFETSTVIGDGNGSVSYEVHNVNTSGYSSLLGQVNKFIRQTEQSTFAGTWMLVAEWRNVSQPGLLMSSLTNTFQGIVITNGYQSYTIFTYHCGSLQWSGNAVIGFKADENFYQIHQLSGSDANLVACQKSPRSLWNNVVYTLSLKQLPFLNIGENKTYLSSTTHDSVSDLITIPRGFPFGNSVHNAVYVSTNGIISLSRSFPYHSPHLFPGASFYNFLVAPFWTDNDISNGIGSVSYQVHDSATESLTWVSSFITQYQQIRFNGNWMLVAEWRNVPQYHGDTSITNTYQAIIVTDGQSSFALFTYNCQQMEWSGDVGIGINGDGRFYANHILSKTENAHRIACLNSPSSDWSNVLYQLDGNYLSFINLDSSPNIKSVTLTPALDAMSDNITISGQFIFGATSFSSLFVSGNGYFSFGRSANFFTPVLFPNSTSYTYIVAPFWADNDLRPSGKVSYEIHNVSTGYMSSVSRYIRQQSGLSFEGSWMLVVEWKDVPEYQSDIDKTNSYQGIVITDGTDSFAVFTYQCGAMTWSGNATIGFNAGGSQFENHPLSGSSNTESIGCMNYNNTVWTNIIFKLTPNMPPFLLYTHQYYYIRRLSIDGRNLRTIYSSGYPRALSFDSKNDYIFWTDTVYDRIYRSHTNGSNVMILVNTGMSCAEGLAWDWVNDKLYWSDACDNDIEVYDPQNGYRQVLVHTSSTSDPRQIVLDPINRLMYWTDNGNEPKIEKVSMDGSSRAVIHATNLTSPYGLALDIGTQTLYWTDYGRDVLESSSVDGTNRKVLTSRMLLYPFYLSFYDGNLYWGDLSYNRLLSTHISSPDDVAFFGSYYYYDFYGVQVISSALQQKAFNPCEESNGNCSHLCLLSSLASEGYSCSCPASLINTIDEPNLCKNPPYLLFSFYSTRYNYIQRSRLDGSERVTLYVGNRPHAIAYDYKNNYLFWMDTYSNGANRLYRSWLNGSQVTTLVTTDIGCSEGLSWDWIGEKLYWTDHCQDEIEVYDPVIAHRKVLITTGSYPYAIKVDPMSGWLYWTDLGTKTIERVSMDGANRTELHSTNLQTPYALAIDYESQTLYWADYSLNRLESSYTDGSNRRLLTTTNIEGIHAMVFFAGNLYWTDWQFNGIHTTPSSAPNNATFLLNLGGDPYDIHVLYDEQQPEGSIISSIV